MEKNTLLRISKNFFLKKESASWALIIYLYREYNSQCIIYVTIWNYNIHWFLIASCLVHKEEWLVFNVEEKTDSVEYISNCYINFQKCYSPKKYLGIILTRFNFALLANFRIWSPIQLYCIPSILQICNTYLLLKASVICISPCRCIITRITICFSFPRTILVHTSCSGININSTLLSMQDPLYDHARYNYIWSCFVISLSIDMHDAVEVNNASVKITNSDNTCLMMLVAIQATMVKTYLLDLCFLPLNFLFPYLL